MYEIWDSYSVSIVCLIAVVVCLWQTWYLKKDFFSPVNVYVFAQCLTLGIAYLKFDKAMTDFSLKTWMVWGGALFSFMLGSLVFYLTNPAKPLERVDTDLGDTYNWRLHFIFSIVLLYVIVALHVVSSISS